jgi:hypothetical protein
MSEKKYDLFISHASEDKDEIVRPLATILEKLSVCVWYDEFSLQLGDSLSVSIDKGLQESRFGLLVLSKAFIAKNWTDYEYRSLLTRQNGGEKVILPLWYGIDADEVKKYSLYLGGIKALSITKETLGKAVDAILQVVRPDIWKELRMRSFLKKKIAEAEPKVMKLSDIKMQTTRQSQLTPQQLVRSKAVYYGIGKHFNYSFDRCVELYELDLVPERELQSWEIMNACYLEMIAHHPECSYEDKNDYYKVLLALSIGAPEVEGVSLDDSAIKELITLWKKNFYE